MPNIWLLVVVKTAKSIVLRNAHIDRCAHIHYVRPDIPIYCSEETKLIKQGSHDAGSNEDCIIFKENLQIKKDKNGEIIKKRGED
jgi:ribonuclease J